MTGRLDGKVALVTGAARGMGEAIARAFVAEGARVLLCDVNEEGGAGVAASLGDAAHFERLDVRSEEGWEGVVGEAVKRFGGLSVLVNNAGILRSNPLAETPLAEYMDVIGINQVGTFLGMRACIPTLMESGAGSIINMSSAQGLEGRARVSAYAASKFAVVGMTRSVALEVAAEGVRANTIHPGGIDTPMTSPGERGKAINEHFIASIPMGRLAHAQEVAPLAVFLASDESAYITGAEFKVDGGMMAGPWP